MSTGFVPFVCTTTLEPRGFLWAHTLAPLNVPIQSEAVIKVSDSDYGLKNGVWLDRRFQKT